MTTRRLAAIKRLYYEAAPSTIERDLARAVEILKSLPDEETRERAAVYMDGLSQMRSEWRLAAKRRPPGRKRSRPRKSTGD